MREARARVWHRRLLQIGERAGRAEREMGGGGWGGVGSDVPHGGGRKRERWGGRLSDRGAGMTLDGAVGGGSACSRRRRAGELGRAAGCGRRDTADRWGRAAMGPGVSGRVREGEG
jgi:hypothetical protein